MKVNKVEYFDNMLLSSETRKRYHVVVKEQSDGPIVTVGNVMSFWASVTMSCVILSATQVELETSGVR